MSDRHTADHDRLLDLLAEELERPLTTAERAELQQLLAANPEWRRDDLALTAAAIQLALEPAGEDMPDDVKARLIGRVVGDATRGPARGAPLNVPQPAGAPAATAATQSGVVERAAGSDDDSERVRDVTVPLREVPSNVIRGPWRERARKITPWIAAAAAIAFAIVGWWPRIDPRAAGGGARDLVTAREEIEEIARAPGSVVVAWSQTEDPLGKAVQGDVVWSPDKQRGFMRFKGLPANDPRVAQYQLWIFDAERDERYPVDGGVFDVGPDGETVIAIDAKVPVGKVTLFAVTLEKPGGVVVSTRERLVALGKVG